MMRYACCGSRGGVCALLAGFAAVMFCPAAHGAVELLGTQYQQDDWFPEFNCIWKDKYYPTSCPVSTAVGCNVHVYLKNTGASSVSVTNVRLQGYDLGTVLKLNTGVHDARSIYFYWDNPPQDILDAGEPVWYKVDPSGAIPPGGVAQVVVRLRFVPVINPVNLSIVTSGGTLNPTIPVNANAPQLASVGFSQDRKKVYLHWRRSGGAAPTTIMMDGVDVTANAATVGDPSVNYAATVLSFTTALGPMSYHVYQGVYADGKTATASVRTWVNKFIHSTYGMFDNYSGQDWIDEATNHGINNCQVAVGGINGYMGTSAGEAYAIAHNYGYTSGDTSKFINMDPDMFFINDEIDAEEANMERTFCGTGLRLPCGKSPMGILAMRSIGEGEALRSLRPMTPTSINMNGSFKPENYYAYGQAVDILQVDPYYQRRLQDVYWRDQNAIPVYRKATYIYAVSKAVATAAEPNPSNVILYSCSWKCTDDSKCDPEFVGQIWPFADPETKRIEAYYALAAGTKGLCYWWMNATAWPSMGLANQTTQAARDLWREIGLYGNEIKTIAPQLVTSHPVDMALTPSTNVWARALASGTDTIILIAVNDDYYNDTTGFHHNPVPNANVVAGLPSWMTSSPTAFEVRASGLYNVATSLNGSNLTVQLGTLDVTRMIVITTNPQLRAAVQQRYDQEVEPGVCAFAPDMCSQDIPPVITSHPQPSTICTGGSTLFTVSATSQSTMTYQWQKNSVNLTNGGHFSGCTTATLAVTGAGSADAANYRCVVSNEFGATNSNQAALTVLECNPNCLTNLGFENGFTSGIGNGWSKFTSVGSITCSDETTEVHGGAHSQAIYSAGKNNAGGVYQRFATVPNQPYTIKAWFKCRSNDGADGNMEGLFGIDVTGGTDPNSSNVAWSSKPYLYWSQDDRTVTAQSSHITLFLLGRATRLNKPGYVFFDDILLAPGAPTAGTPQALGPNSIRWSWTDLGMETGYRVRDTAEADRSGLLPADTTQWTESTGIAANTSYTRYVHAVNECGESDRSNGASAYSLIETPAGVTFGTVTPSSIVVTPVGTFSNLTVGSSGVRSANSTAGTNSGWQTSLASWTSSGLDANTPYAFAARARNAAGVETGDSAVETKWTLSVPPIAGSVTADRLCLPVDENVIWTAVGGFGAGTVEYYRYAWDQSPTHAWTGSEAEWSEWENVTTPTAPGKWYLHVRGYNGEGVANGTYDYAVTAGGAPIAADFDADCDVDEADFTLFSSCLSGPAVPYADNCGSRDLDGDNDVDQSDFGIFQRCYSGENNPADPDCAN